MIEFFEKNLKLELTKFRLAMVGFNKVIEDFKTDPKDDFEKLDNLSEQLEAMNDIKKNITTYRERLREEKSILAKMGGSNVPV